MADRISARMNTLVDSQEMAGGSLIVRRNGTEIYRGNWGHADVAGGRPADEDTIYYMCSMSKPVTAVAVMRLVEEGKLTLDDPVCRFIPEFAGIKVCAVRIGMDGSYEPDPEHPAGLPVPELLKTMTYTEAKRPFTIRDLLTHSSGLGQEAPSLAYMQSVNRPDDTLASRVPRWGAGMLDFQPGEGTGYSPVAGMDTLARIVEIISGMDYQSYLKKYILGPIGAEDLIFQLNADQQARMSKLYRREDAKLVEIHETDTDLPEISSERGYFSGGAGMKGSLRAYDRFTTMLALEGELDGARILKPETVRSMQMEGAVQRLELLPGTRWGLGMIVTEDPTKSGMPVRPGTYGWSGAYGTHMFIHPESGLSATFVMCRVDIGGAGSFISRELEKFVFSEFD